MGSAAGQQDLASGERDNLAFPKRLVALARKLLVAFWKYVTNGVVIEGTVTQAA